MLVLFRRGRLGIQLKEPGVTVGEGQTVDANRVLECLGRKMGPRQEESGNPRGKMECWVAVEGEARRFSLQWARSGAVSTRGGAMDGESAVERHY